MDATDLTLAVCMYNAEPFICQTLRSVLNQTLQGFQLLIVDDCSSDHSVQVAETFLSERHYTYELVRFPENKGIGYARHFAERKADTKYMMFLDADDVLYDTAIEKMYGKINEDADLMVVGCYLAYVDSQNRKIGGGLFLGATSKSEFYQKAQNGKLIFMQTTAIYDRAISLRVGGFVVDGFPAGKPRYADFCEDLDLWTRMSDLYTEHKAIIVIPEILCDYRKSDGLSSNTLPMLLKMRYTKLNLTLRRAHQPQVSFIAFYDSLSTKEILRLQGDAHAAEDLRKGMMFLHRRCYGKACGLVLMSIVRRPSYFLEKLQHNFNPKISRNGF